MFSSRDITPPARQQDYFSITPITAAISETPLMTPLSSPDYQVVTTPQAEPSNPLLAVRPAYSPSYSYRGVVSPIVSPVGNPHGETKPSFGSILQLQTMASYKSVKPCRPQARPVQDVLFVSSDDSDTSSDTSANSNDSTTSRIMSSSSSLETARCSRCQRNAGLDVITGKSNMIQYGLNLWYCNRCAGIVGLPPR